MTADFSLQRRKMVDGQLRTTDVSDSRLLDIFLSVPREAFVPAARRALAYIDEDLAVGSGPDRRYLMEPSPFARLVQLAEVRPDDFVLDVGCATGYSAAVLSRLSNSVVALESDADLAASATATLAELGYDNVAVVEGPLRDGFPSDAPYDVIFVGGAVEEVPGALLDQLKDGGRLVAVIGGGNAGVARLYLRDGAHVSSRPGFNAAVKPLPGFERSAAFEF